MKMEIIQKSCLPFTEWKAADIIPNIIGGF